jgi:hypothetical protein
LRVIIAKINYLIDEEKKFRLKVEVDINKGKIKRVIEIVSYITGGSVAILIVLTYLDSYINMMEKWYYDSEYFISISVLCIYALLIYG